MSAGTIPGRRLSVVSGNREQPEGSFLEAAQALLARALADGAIVLMIAWEDPSGKVTGAAVPGSGALLRGLVGALAETLIPDEAE